MTKTVKRPHLEGRPQATTTAVEDDTPSETLPADLEGLAGGSSLSQEPFPDAVHRHDVERLGGEVHPEGHGPIRHERLVVQSDEMRSRALEDELESGPTLDEERREELEDHAKDEGLSIRRK
jgi:hypothetical protein